MPLSDVLSIILCLSFPFLARTAERRGWAPAWLSSIIACYGVGILVANLRVWAVDEEVLKGVAGASMLVGLPLLLFAVRIKDSLKYARTMLLGFGLCCLAGLLCTAFVGWYLSGEMDDAWQVSGLLVGLYTGGTPNVQSIAVALDAPAEYVALVQASDVLLGGAYLLGLITFLPGVYAYFYPVEDGSSGDDYQALNKPVNFKIQLPQLGIGLMVTAASVGLTWLFAGSIDLTILVLVLTTLALGAGQLSSMQKLGNTYPLGEYFILVFCVAIGLLADFRALAANGMELLYFSALALSATTALHLLLCKLFRLDRDTVILSSVAAFYGPIFVVQVAAALRNQRLLAAGIAVSLLGFGIGNYLGVGLAFAVKWFTVPVG